MQEREAERRKRAAEAGEGYVPPKEDEDDEPIDPRIEKQMEGKLYYQVLDVDRAAGTSVTRLMELRGATGSCYSSARARPPQVRRRSGARTTRRRYCYTRISSPTNPSR